jgi:hypothetical protein
MSLNNVIPWWLLVLEDAKYKYPDPREFLTWLYVTGKHTLPDRIYTKLIQEYEIMVSEL